jgi:hypothetical protein
VYAAQILHGGNTRLNGAPVMDSTNRGLLGMYLCVDVFGTNATFVPWDVLSAHQSITIEPLLVECSGFVRGKNAYIKAAAFRQFDIHAEHGKLLHVKAIQSNKCSADMSLKIPQNKVFEALNQVFVERNNQIVRVRNDYVGYLRTNMTDVVCMLNSVAVANTADFAKALRANEPNVIVWGSQDRETFEPQTRFNYNGHEICAGIRVWNMFKTRFTPAQTTQVKQVGQPCQPFEDI